MANRTRVNRKYKDTVFRLLFGDNPEELLGLYNAVNGTYYTDASDLTINTLEDAIYLGMRNDVSFVFQDYLNLYEHQSSGNPNLPLRDLFYVSDLLQVITMDMNIYGSKRIRIPTPKFVVFYNGEVDSIRETEYRLSDLYEKKDKEPELELVVRIINVNLGQENEILKNCKTLSEYAQFVAMVRENKENLPLREAVTKAVDECIKIGVLKEFLRKHKAQVIKMSIYEYDAEKQRLFDREEGRAEGLEQGLEQGMERGSAIRLISLIQKKIGKSKSISVIADELETDEEGIRPYYDAVFECGTDAPPEKIMEKVGLLR